MDDQQFLNSYHNASTPPGPDVPADLAGFMLAADPILGAAAELSRVLAHAHQGAATQLFGEDWAHARTYFSLSEKYAAWADYNTPARGFGIQNQRHEALKVTPRTSHASSPCQQVPDAVTDLRRRVRSSNATVMPPASHAAKPNWGVARKRSSQGDRDSGAISQENAKSRAIPRLTLGGSDGHPRLPLLAARGRHRARGRVGPDQHHMPGPRIHPGSRLSATCSFPR